MIRSPLLMLSCSKAPRLAWNTMTRIPANAETTPRTCVHDSRSANSASATTAVTAGCVALITVAFMAVV